MDGETRNAVASFDLIELVRSTNREFQVTEELAGIGSAEAMATRRTPAAARSRRVILEKAAKITPEFGIELVDVRFKRINYVDSVQQKVFERMISERKRIAERSRSEGQGRRGRDPRAEESATCLARHRPVGYKNAQENEGRRPTPRPPPSTRAPTASDPEFYQFMKSMETLSATPGQRRRRSCSRRTRRCCASRAAASPR